MTPWEAFKKRQEEREKESSGKEKQEILTEDRGSTPWQQYKNRRKEKGLPEIPTVEKEADFFSAMEREREPVMLPKLSYPKPLSIPSGKQIQKDRAQFSDLYRADNDQFLSGVKGTVAPYYIGAMEEHRASQNPYQSKGYPGLTAKPEPVTDLEARIEPTEDYYAAAIEYAKGVLPYAERAGKTAQVAAEYESSVAELGYDRSVKGYQGRVEDALSRGDWQGAGEHLRQMAQEKFTPEERLEVAKYIDRVTADKNLYGFAESFGAERDREASQEARMAKEHILDLADRGNWEKLYNLMHSPEGAKYKKLLKDGYGIDADSPQSREQNYMGLVSQLEYGDEYGFNTLSKSGESYKTLLGTTAFTQRATEEVQRAAKHEGSAAQMDSFTRAQTAYYVLDQLYDELGFGTDSVVTADNTRTRYLLKFLEEECGVDLTGLNASNGAEMIRKAQDEQGGKADLMNRTLKGQGYDTEVVRQYMENTVQQGLAEEGEKAFKDFWANASVWGKIGMNILSVPHKVFVSPLAAASQLGAMGGRGSDTDDPNSYVPVIARTDGATRVRTATDEDIDSGFWSFVYNAGMSAADSAANALAFGKGATFFMSLAGAGDTANEILARGGSREQALRGGIAAGAIEAMTEYFSIDQLLKGADSVHGLKSLMKSVGQQAFTEGSEEMSSEILNIIVDSVNMGNLSHNSQAVAEYMGKGMGYNEARSKVLMDNIKQVAESGLSGAVSGSMSATAYGLPSAISGAVEQKQLHKAMDLLGNVDERTDAYTISRALHTVGVSISEDNRLATMAELVDQGMSREDAQQITKAAEKAVNGKRLTSAEKNLLQKESPLSQMLRTNLQRESAVGENPEANLLSTAEKSTESAQHSLPETAPNATTAKITGVDDTNTLKLSEDAGVNIESPAQGKETVRGILSDLEIPARAVESFVRDYEESGEQSGELYARGMAEAFLCGFENAPKEAMAESIGLTPFLTERQRNYAYELGRAMGNDYGEGTSAGPALGSEGQKGKPMLKGTSRVQFQGKISSQKLTQIQEDSIEVLDKLAEALGIKIYLYESQLDAEGKPMGDNGWYDQKTGHIHIDLNSGEFGQGTMLFTAAHELTHYIRQWSENKFKILADFLVETYGEKGVSVKELVHRQQEKARLSGRTLDYSAAYEEMVADSMESMLSDGAVVARIAELRAKDKGLAEKIRFWLNWFAVRLRKMYGKMKPDTVEGRLVQEMAEEAEHLKELFAEALADAADHYEAAGAEKNTTVEGGVMYSVREGMTEEQRYNELKDRKISIISGTIQDEYISPLEQLDNIPEKAKSKAEKIIIPLAEQLGILNKTMKTPEVDIEFVFSKNKGLKESLSKQLRYGGSYRDFANALINLDSILENAILIEVHKDKYEGTSRENRNLEAVYVLFGAFKTDKYIIPVQSEIKKVIGSGGRLYMTVAMTKIEAGVLGSADNDNRARSLIPTSITCSIAEVFRNINPSEKHFLKYLPDEFLTEQQKQGKYEAIREDTKRIAGYADAKYLEAVKSGDMETAQRMVDEAAKKAGYTEKVYHGTDAEFTEFRRGELGIHVGTIEQAKARDDKRVISLYAKLGDSFVIYSDYGDWHGKNTAAMMLETEEVEALARHDDSKYAEIESKLREIAEMPDDEHTDTILREYLQSLGWNSITYENRFEDAGNGDDENWSYIVFDPNEVKSADPVTYDDNGNVIPLSERFNEKETDIRHSARGNLTTRSILTDLDPSTVDNELERKHLVAYQENSRGHNLQRKLHKKAMERLEALSKEAKPDKRQMGQAKAAATKAKNRMDIYAKMLEEAEYGTHLRRLINREVKKVLSTAVSTYGAIPAGENAATDRVVEMPKSVDGKKNVSRVARSAAEAVMTPKDFVPMIEEAVVNGFLSYDPDTNKAQVDRAHKWLEHNGWKDSLFEWITNAANKKRLTKDDVAKGIILYNNLANQANAAKTEEERIERGKDAIRVLSELQNMVTEQAQALQAMRIMKKQAPEMQYFALQKSVKKIEEEMTERLKKKLPNGIQLNETLVAEWMDAIRSEDENRIEAAEKTLYRDIAAQIPVTFREKWNSWRYLAMLLNPRTHIRNILGNAGFFPVRMLKDSLATGMEAFGSRVSGGRMHRTKAALNLVGKADRALLSAAMGDYKNVEGLVQSGGKYNDNANDKIMKERRMFKAGWLEGLRKLNEAGLGNEDMWFSKPAYAMALAGYFKANGITAEQMQAGSISEEELDRARAYAIREAAKATYRDTNEFSTFISKIGRHNTGNQVLSTIDKVGGAMIEGVLPFKKTPANILVRGVGEYSPIGLLRGVKQLAWDVPHGNRTAAEGIDMLASGLTGSALLGLGIWLCSIGLISGVEDDEKKREFEQLMGSQNYALNLGEGNYTIDWLAPEALPVFVGVEIAEAFRDRDGSINVKTVLDALSNISEPILEMSMLSSLNDLLDDISYSDSKIWSILATAATNYLTQFVPSIFGSIERTTEDRRYTTYADKDHAFLQEDWQYLLANLENKAPGEYKQIPFVDAWGREEDTGEVAFRLFSNFISPGYYSETVKTPVDDELVRLYDLGYEGAFPQRVKHSYKISYKVGEDTVKRYLEAEEYTTYAKTKGQTGLDLLCTICDSPWYSELNDKTKADVVEYAYSYANEVGKSTAVSQYQTEEGWEAKAIQAKEQGITPDIFIRAKIATSGIVSIRNEDGNPISNSKGLLLMREIYKIDGLTDEQRKYLFAAFGVGGKVIGYSQREVDRALKSMGMN